MSRALIGSLVALGAFLAISAVASLIKHGAGKRPNVIGGLIVGALLLGIPLAVAVFVGFLASALLIAADVPPPTYIFILFLASIAFRAAVKHRGAGMEGCSTKLFGLMWSGYAMIWSIVSFEATGGLRALRTGEISMQWLLPAVTALPFALFTLTVAERKKRTLWLFLGVMAIMSAGTALIFLPIENGFLQRLLPASDWLRFPLAGLTVGALWTLVRMAIAWDSNPRVRRVRIRDLKTSTRVMLTLFLLLGLGWAAARQALLLIG
jgi:hypothetical protein